MQAGVTREFVLVLGALAEDLPVLGMCQCRTRCELRFGALTAYIRLGSVEGLDRVFPGW